jgi:regulator of cell morphogenesis and NO signaling
VHEHDNAGSALEAMRASTGDYTLPADACNTYRALFTGLQEMEADLHQHIHLENNILFPRAVKMEEPTQD